MCHKKGHPKLLDIYLKILMAFIKCFFTSFTFVHSYFSPRVIKKFISIP